MIFYTQPLTLICLMIISAGIVRLVRSGHKDLAIAGVLALFLISWAPAAWLFSRPLEARYPLKPFQASGRTEAIIVLGAGISPALYERPYPLADGDTVERCEHAIWLYHRFGPAPILASGGRFEKHPTVAAGVRELLLRGGIPDALIWTEERSRSTHENAFYSAEILRRNGVRRAVLVVDATSMPRAAACFRKEGIEVTPAPSRFFQLDWTINDLLPGWEAIRQNEITLHESFGLLWYRIRGWI